MWYYYILGYIAIWLLFGCGSVVYDFYRYKTHNYLDNKFPITSIETQKLIMFLTFLWPLWVMIAIWSFGHYVCGLVKKCLC